MKILLMNEFLIKGGAEVQGLREKKILEDKGHNVIMLTFDNNFPENHEYFNKENGFINIKVKENNLLKLINRLIINLQLKKKIENVINMYQPDIIHANNIFNCTITKYKIINKFKNVQTIRDYIAVCPLSTCIKVNGEVCKGSKYNNCYRECGKSIDSVCRIFVNTISNNVRKNNINKFICPSEKLTQYCQEHGYNIECVNNPFDFEKISNIKKNIDFNKKKYLYYGTINEEKGIFTFIDSFIKFSKDKNVKLVIAGEVKNNLKDYFINKIKNNNKIEYKGFLNYDDMMKELIDVYTVVVPSKWMENYPNTVLEGQATGTLVVGSNRGGIPDMLSNGKGFIFDIDNESSIIKCLEMTYDLSKDEYYNIVLNSKKFVENNNSFDNYYSKIMNIFSKL